MKELKFTDWFFVPLSDIVFHLYFYFILFLFKNTRMLSELQASFLNFGFSSFTLAAI